MRRSAVRPRHSRCAYYEREICPAKNDGIINARPREGAHEAIDAVASRGLRCALLTNPSFQPARASSAAWAGGDMLDAARFELVTTMEEQHALQAADYYLASIAKDGP